MGSAIFFIKKLSIVLRRLNLVKNLLEDQRNWFKTEGKILRLGVNVDYSYAEKLPSLDGIETDEEFEFAKDKFIRDLQRREKMKEFLGVLIKYSYIYEGKRYISRRIAVIPDKKDIDLVYKYKLGDFINININKVNPNYSVVEGISDDRYPKYMWGELLTLKSEISLLIISIVFTIAVF